MHVHSSKSGQPDKIAYDPTRSLDLAYFGGSPFNIIGGSPRPRGGKPPRQPPRGLLGVGGWAIN